MSVRPSLPGCYPRLEPDHFRVVGEPRTQRASTSLDLIARAPNGWGGMVKAAAQAANDEFGTAASCLSRE
jgi:hypothetical protein